MQVRHVAQEEPVDIRHASGQDAIEQVRLVGRDVEALEVLVNGVEDPLLVAVALGQDPQGTPLVEEMPRPQSGRLLIAVLLVQGAGLEYGRGVQFFVRMAQEQVGKDRYVVLYHGFAEPLIILAIAESLRAKIVRHPSSAQDRQHLPGGLGRLRQGQCELAEADREAIAGQMARLELVRVAGGPQDAHVGDRYLLQLLRPNVLQGDPLAGDGASVFQARQPDLPAHDAQGPGEAVEGLPRADAFLLDQGVRMIARAARLVQRQLLDEEILRPGLDHAADSGQIHREKGKRIVHKAVRFTIYDLQFIIRGGGGIGLTGRISPMQLRGSGPPAEW